MGINICEIIELCIAIIVEAFLVIIKSTHNYGKIQVKDEVAVAFGGRILSDVKLAEEAFKLILLVDVVIVFEHGEGKALAETARANEEEIHVRFFYFLYEWGLVNIVTISIHYILKVLHSVRDALAIDSLLSFYFCHNRNQLFVFMPQS